MPEMVVPVVMVVHREIFLDLLLLLVVPVVPVVWWLHSM